MSHYLAKLIEQRARSMEMARYCAGMLDSDKDGLVAPDAVAYWVAMARCYNQAICANLHGTATADSLVGKFASRTMPR